MVRFFQLSEQPLLENVEVDGVYACKASANGKWYRAIIIEIYCPKRIKIQYIDWGITEIVRQNQ
jgi:Tudor domain